MFRKYMFKTKLNDIIDKKMECPLLSFFLSIPVMKMP